MATIEAQRTLVKSPPELWAELSDPVSLARHLGEFGEIRIARIEAETSVEWEAESASGTVELKPSGWGTKVTLTVARETPQPVVAEPEPAEPEPVAPEPESAEPPSASVVAAPPTPSVVAEPEPVAPEPESAKPPSPSVVAAPPHEPESVPAAADPPPRFFARLFRRWRRERPSVEPDPAPPPAPAAEAEALSELAPTPAATPELAPTPAATPELAPTLEATPEPAPTPPAVHEPPLDLAAELAAELEQVEATIAEQDAELLSAVLDRLGAAHHRPFSRG